MNKVNNLAKLFIIYQLFYMTSDRTRVVNDVLKSLKKNLRKVLFHDESTYREAEKLQNKLYDQAWRNSFTEGTKQIIEVGTVATILFESIDTSFSSKFIGTKKMEKALDSYYFAGKSKEDAVEVESRSIMFANNIIELFDDKQELTPFQRKMIIAKQNHIIDKG